LDASGCGVIMPVRVESERKPHLDGLRGVAASVVFFGHLSLALTNAIWIFNGNAAVCIFFVLSGYVLSDLAQRSQLSLLAQATRRYLRLFFPMLITSAFAWALLDAGAYRNQQAAALLNTEWLGIWYRFAPDFTAMLGETVYGVFASGSSDYNCNLWTMRPELIGSLYVFGINAIAPTRGLRALGFLLLGVIYWSDYVLLFCVGSLLHDFEDKIARALKWGWVKPVLFAVGLFLCVATEKWLAALHFPPVNMMYWHMLAATMVVSSALYWPRLQAILGCAVGQWLGRISFTLYLVHVPIICSLTSWIVISFPLNVAIPAAAAITIIVVYSISTAAYRYVDQKPTRWSRSIGYLLDFNFLKFTKPA
jgi:peptidoglycan/LPS O-acetylase OafA/YrhL